MIPQLRSKVGSRQDFTKTGPSAELPQFTFVKFTVLCDQLCFLPGAWFHGDLG